MKITKRQLRRIIKEEKAKLLREEEDMSMYDDITKAPLNLPPNPGKQSKAQANIVTDMEVPAELFDEMVEFLEDISDSGTQSGGFGKRARELLLKMERELGIL